MGHPQQRPAWNRRRVKGGTYIGLWHDPRSKDSAYPRVEAAIDASWDRAERAAVIEYLEAGRVNDTYRGHSQCRLCGCSNGSSDLTDGLPDAAAGNVVYVWPSGLAHYLREHDVRPPAAFIAHVLRQPPPPMDTTALLQQRLKTLSRGRRYPAVAAAGAEHIRERLKGR